MNMLKACAITINISFYFLNGTRPGLILLFVSSRGPEKLKWWSGSKRLVNAYNALSCKLIEHSNDLFRICIHELA